MASYCISMDNLYDQLLLRNNWSCFITLPVGRWFSDTCFTKLRTQFFLVISTFQIIWWNQFNYIVFFYRFLWNYLYNVFGKSFPSSYLYIFLGSYAPEHHLFVTKMVPLFYGNYIFLKNSNKPILKIKKETVTKISK